MDDDELEIDEVCHQVSREAVRLYVESPRLTKLMLRAAHRYERMSWVVKERDKFSRRLGARLHTAFPAVPRRVCDDSARESADMVGGVIENHLNRGSMSDELERTLERVARAIDAELAWLRQRNLAAQPPQY